MVLLGQLCVSSARAKRTGEGEGREEGREGRKGLKGGERVKGGEGRGGREGREGLKGGEGRVEGREDEGMGRGKRGEWVKSVKCQVSITDLATDTALGPHKDIKWTNDR